jgi:hypothetical protein
MSVQSFFLWREVAGSFTVKQNAKFCRFISGSSLGVQPLHAQAQSMRNIVPMLLVWLEYRNMPEAPLDIAVTYSAASPVTGTSFFKTLLVFQRNFTPLYLTKDFHGDFPLRRCCQPGLLQHCPLLLVQKWHVYVH